MKSAVSTISRKNSRLKDRARGQCHFIFREVIQAHSRKKHTNTNASRYLTPAIFANLAALTASSGVPLPSCSTTLPWRAFWPLCLRKKLNASSYEPHRKMMSLHEHTSHSVASAVTPCMHAIQCSLLFYSVLQWNRR
jgi:hypothetical protein